MENHDSQRLIRVKKNLQKKRPSFRRIESWRYKRVKGGWRAAKGIDSDTRQKKKNGVKSPNVGYRTPKKVRGLHPSGLKEVIIYNSNELENLSPKKHGIKIASSVGNKKRLNIIEKAKSKKFKILNLGISYSEELKMKKLLSSSESSSK